MRERGGACRLGDFLRQHHDEIIARWEEAVQTLRPARALRRPALLDHIPDFLRDIADYVSQAREDDQAQPPREFPTIHALERLDLGYDLSEVVREYTILRRCITSLAQQEHAPALLSVELPLLHEALDLAIGVSVTRYANARERTLKALDRISTATLVDPELDAFLPRILNALLETTPSIDSASVLLVNGELEVRAAAGFAQQPQEAKPLAKGECLAGKVWETGEAVLTEDAAHDPRVTTETIRKTGTRAIYGVPLFSGKEIVGVALIGSCSTHRFSHEDLLLFRTAANRIAALIVQARMDSEIRRQRSLYESVIVALGDLGEGFAVVEDRKFLLINEGLSRIVGRSESELKGLQDVLELAPPEEREPLKKAIARRLESEPDRLESQLIATTLVHADGRLVDVELGVKRKANGRVVVIVRDVSARSALEQARAEERARLETVLRVLPVGLVIAEAPSGKLILGNAAAESIWGRPVTAVSVDEYRSFEGYWPDGRRIAESEWPVTRAIREGLSTQSAEIHIVAGDGATRITRQGAAPVRNASGEIVAAVVTIVDVTEQQQNEQQLKDALEFKERVLNILAHDLRQPLSVIAGSATLLLRDEKLVGHASALRRQLRGVERMDRLIRDLLDYARSRQGAMPLSRRPVALREVAREAVDAVASLEAGQRIRLEASGECVGNFDPDRMMQVFSNLLGNAIAYSEPGSPIRVALNDDGRQISVSVHNLGEPIPAEKIGSLFEPFRRGGAGGNPGGLGLGLYIVKQIVEAHGGTVRAASSAEAGTTFTVTLPKE